MGSSKKQISELSTYPPKRPLKVAILGGGLSGLIIGRLLQKTIIPSPSRPQEMIAIFESNSQIGGRLGQSLISQASIAKLQSSHITESSWKQLQEIFATKTDPPFSDLGNLLNYDLDFHPISNIQFFTHQKISLNFRMPQFHFVENPSDPQENETPFLPFQNPFATDLDFLWYWRKQIQFKTPQDLLFLFQTGKVGDIFQRPQKALSELDSQPGPEMKDLPDKTMGSKIHFEIFKNQRIMHLHSQALMDSNQIRLKSDFIICTHELQQIDPLSPLKAKSTHHFLVFKHLFLIKNKSIEVPTNINLNSNSTDSKWSEDFSELIYLPEKIHPHLRQIQIFHQKNLNQTFIEVSLFHQNQSTKNILTFLSEKVFANMSFSDLEWVTSSFDVIEKQNQPLPAFADLEGILFAGDALGPQNTDSLISSSYKAVKYLTQIIESNSNSQGN